LCEGVQAVAAMIQDIFRQYFHDHPEWLRTRSNEEVIAHFSKEHSKIEADNGVKEATFNAKNHMKKSGKGKVSGRPTIIKCKTRNRSPSSSKTMRLPKRRRPRTVFPSASLSGGSTLRKTNGLTSRTFSRTCPTVRH
jgi:hypothetical protein